MKALVPPEIRFWQKVRMGSGCWEWQGCLSHGYGCFFVGPKRGQRMLAHRFAYERTFGPVGTGRVVMHRCDNPRCVRPAHLIEGSQQDNIADMFAKGRGVPVPQNALKAHCSRGHEYAGANLVIHKSGARRCRTCQNDGARSRYIAKAAPAGQRVGRFVVVRIDDPAILARTTFREIYSVVEDGADHRHAVVQHRDGGHECLGHLETCVAVIAVLFLKLRGESPMAVEERP